jgi:DNA-binding MarR family transcriptional regulator
MPANKRTQFGGLLGSIMRAASRLERERVCCGELTFQQFETLLRIERSGNLSVRSLSDDLGIDESTASRNVSVLVRDGYLLKRRDEADGRAVRLVLSSKGKAALNTLQCGEEEVLSAIFDRLLPQDRVGIIRALEKVDAALSREAFQCCEPDREPTLTTPAGASARQSRLPRTLTPKYM